MTANLKDYRLVRNNTHSDIYTQAIANSTVPSRTLNVNLFAPCMGSSVNQLSVDCHQELEGAQVK